MPLDATSTVFAEEQLTDLRGEMSGMLARHWLEAGHRPDVPPDLNWENYRCMEAAGALFTLAARINGRLIGYAVYIIWNHPHHRTLLVADADMFFINETDRRGPVGRRLLETAERMLRERGVHEIRLGTRLWNRTSRGLRSLRPLMERMGYRQLSVVYTKELD